MTAAKLKAAPDPQPESPYGDAPTFTYTPKGGGEPIVFPSADVLWETVDGVKPNKFLYRIRKLNGMYQEFAFLDRAKIPEDVAERFLDLDEDERTEMMRRWFDEVSNAPTDGTLPPES